MTPGHEQENARGHGGRALGQVALLPALYLPLRLHTLGEVGPAMRPELRYYAQQAATCVCQDGSVVQRGTGNGKRDPHVPASPADSSGRALLAGRLPPPRGSPEGFGWQGVGNRSH